MSSREAQRPIHIVMPLKDGPELVAMIRDSKLTAYVEELGPKYRHLSDETIERAARSLALVDALLAYSELMKWQVSGHKDYIYKKLRMENRKARNQKVKSALMKPVSAIRS